jgi:hypothetical protein
MTFHQGKKTAFRIVLALVWIGYAALCFAAPPDLTKPLTGRLRGGYMGESDFDLLAMMSRNGMNAAIAKFGRIAVPLSESSEATIRKWADECDRLNLAFLPVFNWWGADEARWIKDYNHVVTGSGKVLDNTPCPYTRDFWDRGITPRLVAIGRSLKGRPLAAVCIDMEMYGAESVHYQDGCYCDQCFARFLQAGGRPGMIPAPADRGRIIKEAGKLDAYQAVQREATRTFAASCREAVHKVRPGLRFGVLHLDQAIPVQQGLALGFGTPDLPVLCLTERTYSSGHTPYIVSAQESFRAMGAYVDVLVGFWQSKFPPGNVAEQLYHIAHDSYGYWIYTMQTFGKADYHPLPGTPEEYWAAIREANRELDKLGADGAYRTALRIRCFEPPATPLPWGDFRKYDLVSGSGAAPPMPGVWLRGTNWIYFYAKQGDRIAFELTRRQIGSYADSIRVGMISPVGTRLAEGTAKKDQPAVLQAVAPETGVYGLVIVTGAVAGEVTRASHPYAAHIAGPGGAGFVTRLPPLFVALSPDAAAVEFEFVTDNSAEAVKATVLAENGAELWSGVVEGATKVRIGKPSGTRVRLKFERLPGHTFEDVRVRGVKGVLPFAATDPSGLLIGRPAPLQ